MAQLKWLLIVGFFFEMSFQGSRPLISLRMTAMGSTPAEIGTLLALAAVLPFAIGLPLGSLVDRLGPSRVLVGGSCLACLSYVAMAAVPTPYTMALAFSAGQMGITATVVAAHFLVSVFGRPAEREQNYGWFATATATAQVVGPALAGLLADQFSIPLVFLYSAAVSATPILLQGRVMAAAGAQQAQRRLATAAVPATTQPVPPARQRGGLQLLKVPQVRLMAVAAFCTLMAFDIRTSFLPVYLSSVGLSKSQIGLLYAVFAVAGMGIRPLTGLITRHLGSWRALVLAMAVSVPALFVMPMASSPALIGLVLAVMGLSFGLSQPLTMALAAGATGDAERGQALGIRMSSMRLANLVSPLILGVVATVAGLSSVFLVAGCFTLTGALACSRGAGLGTRPPATVAAR